MDGYTNESRLLQQATQKLEKQLTSAHAQNESLQRTFHQNELSYQEKVKECGQHPTGNMHRCLGCHSLDQRM